MDVTFNLINQKYAAEIASWRYEPPYDAYGYADCDVVSTVESLMKEDNHFYAVLFRGELIGYRSFGEDGRVSGGTYDGSYLDTGGGLRPDLTGKGLGPEIIEKGLWFGRMAFECRRFRVTIADFNVRARKACVKVGFSPYDSFARESDGEPFTIFTIELSE